MSSCGLQSQPSSSSSLLYSNNMHLSIFHALVQFMIEFINLMTMPARNSHMHPNLDHQPQQQQQQQQQQPVPVHVSIFPLSTYIEHTVGSNVHYYSADVSDD